MTERLYVFKGFERFWHWTQAALVMFMMATGFEIHGVYKLVGFEKAVNWHTIAAWCLVGLWVFAIFWHVTTGEWRHYVPTLQKVGAMIDFYSRGIFVDAPHPFRPSLQTKHNPLQRLAYLGILVLVMPLIWITGWLYLFYGDWGKWGLSGLDLKWVALGHTIGAFAIGVFLIAHLYLATTGHTPTSQLKAMITGWDEH